MTYRQDMIGLRGESFADIARRLGSVNGVEIPSDATDQQALDLIGDTLTAEAAVQAGLVAADRAAVEGYLAGLTGGVLVAQALFGDSRALFSGQFGRTATSSDWKGLLIGYGFWSLDVAIGAPTICATLEWRASTSMCA